MNDLEIIDEVYIIKKPRIELTEKQKQLIRWVKGQTYIYPPNELGKLPPASNADDKEG